MKTNKVAAFTLPCGRTKLFRNGVEIPCVHRIDYEDTGEGCGTALVQLGEHYYVDEFPAVSDVTQQLIDRDTLGRAKYGTSLDRTDLTTADWLQHMAEECLDAAGYALAAKRTLVPNAIPVDVPTSGLVRKPGANVTVTDGDWNGTYQQWQDRSGLVRK